MIHSARAVRRGSLLVLPSALLLSAVTAHGQTLPLKREPPPVAWAGCRPVAPVVEVTPAARLAAAQLAASAREAAILGDIESAHRQLLQAVALDPGAADLAYRLALMLEQVARPREAVASYCRYLALSPEAPDADEVRAHIDDLLAAGITVSGEAAAAFTAAIASFDAGRAAAALAGFAAARRLEPAWGAPLYNLAAVRLAEGDVDAALDELRVYLEMYPDAPDFNDVLAVVLSYRPASVTRFRPGMALAGGLVVPGLGHFMTARPLAGALVLGTAGVAAAAALGVTRRDVVCLAPPVDGKCPAGQLLEERTERPFFVVGMAVAAAVGVLGAIDAYRGARSRNAQADLPRQGAARGEAPAVLPPRVRPGVGGLEIEFIRLSF